MIVRGVVGQPRSYLSDDQVDVLTDDPLLKPTVLFQNDATSLGLAAEREGVTVTVRGGTIEINGLTFTSKHAALPGLEPGSEEILCLKRVGSRNLIALTFYGAFRVESQGLAPLSRKQGFAPEIEHVPSATVIAELVARARSLHQGR